jgi:hypothetical protein
MNLALILRRARSARLEGGGLYGLTLRDGGFAASSG